MADWSAASPKHLTSSSSLSSSSSRRLYFFSRRTSADDRRRRAILDTDEFTDVSNSNTQEIHQLHRSLPPIMWGVSLDDLAVFKSEVRNTLQLGLISNYGEEHPLHNPHHWEERIGPNIHQVNKCYIKPVTWRSGGMSYALMLNEAGLKSDVFATHCWNEGVFEFVEKCRLTWPRTAHSLWCCFLANPQNSDISELLSGSVLQSPFAQALSQASYMIVLPNHDCSIYTRLWCVLEAKLAVEYDVDIILQPRVTRRGRCMLFLPTLAVGVAAAAYTWGISSMFDYSIRDAMIFIALLIAPVAAAAGFHWWSRGRYVRLEIQARVMIIACVSAILYFLLDKHEQVKSLLRRTEDEEELDEGCEFRDILNLCSDMAVLLNIVFIGVATSYKRRRRKKSGGVEPSNSASSDDEDENDDDDGEELLEEEASADGSEQLQRDLGDTLILWGEIIFVAWFFLEILVRVIASYAVCPLFSVGSLVMELTFNTLAVTDIALTCSSRNGSSTCGQRYVWCFGFCGTFSIIVACFGKITPHVNKITKVRRIVRLLKLLRLTRLIRLLDYPRTWWLCWCLVATFLFVGLNTAIERTLQEELKGSSAQLEFTSVRHATCSHKKDQIRLFSAIEGKEDEIDSTIRVLQMAGKYDRDVKTMLLLGFEISRTNTRYDWPGVVHAGVLWTAFCAATDNGINPAWWVAPFYILISAAAASCRRPRAYRFNFAVASWRRPVWGALTLALLFEILGISPSAVDIAKYGVRFWSISAAAMGRKAASFLFYTLWRWPTRYACIDFLLLSWVLIWSVGPMSYACFLHFEYVSCVESSVGQIPTNFTSYFGDKYFEGYKQCYFHWALCYHLMLFGLGLLWTVCGFLHEQRTRVVDASKFGEEDRDIGGAMRRATISEPKVEADAVGLDDCMTRVQWLELAERSRN